MLVSIQADIPSDVQIDKVEPTQLPSDWRTIPAPQSLALIGDNWFTSVSTAVLMVPSAIIPVEKNYLLNPLHKDFDKIKIHSPEPFVLEPRMWKNT